jgi:hypothetical protein
MVRLLEENARSKIPEVIFRHTPEGEETAHVDLMKWLHVAARIKPLLNGIVTNLVFTTPRNEINLLF